MILMLAALSIRIASGFVTLAALTPPAMAATETVLYSFPNNQTGYPSGTLYFRNGSLYGTGASGGKAGQVFKLTSSGGSWREKTLVAFDGANGSAPFAGLIRDSNGVLYGTTSAGDAYNGGSVFTLVKGGGKWILQTIWAFGGTSGDGTQPECDLVMDKTGNLFGTTYAGGTYNLGTVFELSNVNGLWTETVLHSFKGNGDGWFPYAGLLMAGSETFYGTTIYGGNYGNGTVYKLFNSGGVWKLNILYSFTGGSDGYEPWGTLIRDRNGALYGTTYAGGTYDVGTVFMLSPSGGKWTETVLHTFQFDNGSNDGYNPLAGLRWSPSGSLYGTTSEGGSPGGGTVFELTESGGVWTETILHGFGGAGDGVYPQGDVTLDTSGVLYGTAASGGANNFGAVWEIIP